MGGGSLPVRARTPPAAAATGRWHRHPTPTPTHSPHPSGWPQASHHPPQLMIGRGRWWAPWWVVPDPCGVPGHLAAARRYRSGTHPLLTTPPTLPPHVVTLQPPQCVLPTFWRGGMGMHALVVPPCPSPGERRCERWRRRVGGGGCPPITRCVCIRFERLKFWAVLCDVCGRAAGTCVVVQSVLTAPARRVRWCVQLVREYEFTVPVLRVRLYSSRRVCHYVGCPRYSSWAWIYKGSHTHGYRACTEIGVGGWRGCVRRVVVVQNCWGSGPPLFRTC